MRWWLALALAAGGCNLAAGLDDLSFSNGGADGAGGTSVGGNGMSGGAGGGGGAATTLTFTDDDAADFGAGTLLDVTWATDHVELVLGSTSGELVSRVFDSQVDGVRWVTLSHVAPVPYGASLPDDNEVESEFADGVDMRDNILLLHFDGAGTLTGGATVPDTSGHGNDFTVVTNGTGIDLVPSPLGTAAADTVATRMVRTVSAGSDFEFGTDDFTWMTWVQYTPGYDCTSNLSIIGLDGGTGTHMWMGCAEPDADCQPTGGPFGGGTWRADHASADGETFCGTTTINDGGWHHLAAVRSGYPNGVIRFYVDGVEEDVANISWDNPFDFASALELNIGAWSAAKDSAATIDELAMFRRALDADEIRAIHLRGAASITFQVRACPTEGCNGIAFVGPDGTPGTVFTHPSGMRTPDAPITLPSGLTGRFFQYRAQFATMAATPELTSVTVQAALP